jgi:hypothetical protein
MFHGTSFIGAESFCNESAQVGFGGAAEKALKNQTGFMDGLRMLLLCFLPGYVRNAVSVRTRIAPVGPDAYARRRSLTRSVHAFPSLPQATAAGRCRRNPGVIPAQRCVSDQSDGNLPDAS